MKLAIVKLNISRKETKLAMLLLFYVMKQNYFPSALTCKIFNQNPYKLAYSSFIGKNNRKSISKFWMLSALLITFLLGNYSYGQVANYVFSESAGTYSSLTTPTVAFASAWDDSVSANTIPLGFTFNFNGTGYTTCSINTNGFITFGATVSASTNYAAISTATAYSGAVCALSYDLVSNGSAIEYKTIGVSPNQTFVVQWKNANRYSGSVIAGDFDFQIRLSETSNVVEIVYGTCAPATNSNYNVQVGLRGALNSDYNNRSFASNMVWDNNTTAGGANSATVRTRSNAYPNSGRTFTWTPRPTITSISPLTGCPGSNLTINGTNLIGATAANVKIGGTAVSSIVSNTGTVLVVTVGTATTGTVAVTTPGGTATSASTFTFLAVPNITAQPVAPAAVCSGSGTRTISVTATGTGGATPYQWRRNGVNLTNSAPYSNVTTATLTITNPSTSDAGSFDVVTTNALGCTTTSNAVTLTVNPTPAAIGGGAATVCTGATTTAFTNATGGGTWTMSNANATINNGTGIVTGVTAGAVNVIYTVGTCSVSTPITVNTTPAAIGGGAVTVCTGATTPAFTNATGGGTWTTSNANATINNGTGIVTGVTAGAVNVIYTVGTCSVSTAINVNVTPTITTNPSNSAIAVGANTSFTTAASNTPTSYTWQVSTDGGGTWTTVVNGGVYTNATTATLNITAAPIGMNGYQYHASATNACGTSTVSTAATLTVSIAYCAPTYSSGDSLGDEITNVTLGTLTNTTGVSLSPYYTFYNAVTIPNLLQSSTATVSVSLGSDSNQFVGVWIDFNQDGVFQATEGVVSSVTAGANGTTLINIPVPAGATLGNTRMRVRGGNDTALLTSQACGVSSSSFGETEDYIVNIVVAPACLSPTAQPTALILTPGSTTITGSFTAASPVPDHYLVVVNTTGVAPVPSNGTTYSIGNPVGAGNTVVDTDNNITFTASGLSPNTLYYIFVFSYNADCIGGPLYYTTSPLNGSTTTSNASYCTPTGTLNCTLNDYISNVTFNTLNNSSTCGAGGYTVFPATGAQTTSVMKGNSYNLSLSVGAGSGTHGAGVWIDFNQNGLFTDAGEFFLVSNTIAASSTTTISIPIPIGANAGATQMRVRFAYNTIVSSTMSCTTTGTYGETEDYTITLTNPAACVTPTAQPTALVLTPTSTAIGGSFTYPSPTANNYLVIINTTNAVPVPVNGTTYAIGGTVGAGNTVVDIDGNNTFLASGLSPTTTYYIYVFSYNSLCTGGPLYYTATPLNGTSTTSAASLYCTPSVTSGWESWSYISNVSFVGTLNDTSNNSTYSAAPLGYQDYTGLPIKSSQAQGEGVNIFVQAKNTSYMKAWVDWNKDGTFADPGERVYDTGGVATYSTTFGFIIPGATAVGNYRVRIRTNSKDTAAPYDANSTPTFTPCGNINYGGETEDYLFTVVPSCSSLITSVTDGVTCGPGTVILNVTGSVGVTSYKWYSALTGGTLLATTAVGIWTTPSLATTTTYYVTAINGCESLVRTAVVANVNPVPTLNFSPSSPTVCGENTVITLNASGDKQQTYLINENFETGTLGVFSNTNYVSNGGAINALTAWQPRTSTFVPAQQVWFPAISSGFGTNKFAMTTADVGSYITHNAIISPTVNSTGYLDLTLTFKAFYSRYYIDETTLAKDYMTVDISIDGGTVWTELARYTADIGIGTRFQDLSFNLNAYINQSNLKVRIRYYGEWVDGIAIDEVKLFGYVPLNTAFSWSSDSPVNAFADFACTIPYSTAIPTVYIRPTLAQLETGSWNFTAIATLANGCSASQPITVTNNSKVWQNTASTDWNTASNWKPAGVPTSSNCVIIPNNTIISGSAYDAYAKNVTVKPSGILNLQSSNNLTVTDWVTVETGGAFNIKNNASLVQINSVANSGIVNMERITQPMYLYDYTYWGSPNTTASGFTLGNLSSGSSYKYTWTPSVGGVSGNWIAAAAGTVMTAGKGFIVRAPDTYSTNPATKVNFTANFIGTPNNGDVTTPITYGTMGAGATDDKWNLISNPYPSAVSANSFLGLASNVPVIGGTIYFWTHNSAPSAAYPDPFYGDYVINYTDTDYSSWNKLGGTGTAAITGFSTPGGYIAAGEAFFVKSLGVAGNATFNNAMRVTNNNNQFFRSANPITTADSEGNNDFEKHRIWLNLTNNSGAFSQILVGYAEGATTGMDRDFDGTRFGGNAVTFYSILPEANLGIQGRPLPFTDTDQVTLGFNAVSAGSYSVRIDHIDGLFDAQDIYLEDKMLNVIHNLKSAPYVFNTAAGNFNNRFVLRYTNNTLGTGTVNFDNTVKVTVNEKVTIHSSNQPIKNIVVFDLLGRKIDTYKNVDSTQFTLNHLSKTMNILILKITLDNDVIVTQKISY